MTDERKSKFDEIKIHSTEVLDEPLKTAPYRKPIEIIVNESVWAYVMQHAQENLRHESGGLLFGKIYHYEGQVAVRITAAIAAREAETSIASVVFTYKSQVQMRQEQEMSNPDTAIVGWYHTHPNLGAYYSITDYENHENHFKEPYHVGLVIDPIRYESIFYSWSGKELLQNKSFLLEVQTVTMPQQPLRSSFRAALKREILSLKGDEHETQLLRHELERILKQVPSVSYSSEHYDLFWLMQECLSLSPEAQALIKKSLEKQNTPLAISLRQSYEFATASRSQVVLKNNTMLSHNRDSTVLSLQRLEALGIAQLIPYTQQIKLFDMDYQNNIYIYTQSPKSQFWLTTMTQSIASLRVHQLEINWQDFKEAATYQLLLVGQSFLYLFSDDYLFVLQMRGLTQFMVVAQFQANDFNLRDFSQLHDACVDTMNRLFLLTDASIFEYDPFQQEMRELIPIDSATKVRYLCVGTRLMYLYDEKEECLLAYQYPKPNFVKKLALDSKIVEAGIRKLFSDTAAGLYLITNRKAYYFV